MKDVKKSNSGIPLIIIVLVFAGVVFGGWWLYRQSTPDNSNPNRANTATPRPTVDFSKAPPGATPGHFLGSPTAMVTLEEFADFQCGSCAATHPVLKEIQSIYGSRIRLIFRNYPLQNHDKAFDAATSAEAAGMQGKFWQMQDQLFSNQTSWAGSPNYRQLWADYAQKIGLDVQKWQTDAAGIAAQSRVQQDMDRARFLGVGATPTLYINNQSIPYGEMNVASLRRIIDAELQKTSASQAPVTQAPASNPSGQTNATNAKPSR